MGIVKTHNTSPKAALFVLYRLSFPINSIKLADPFPVGEQTPTREIIAIVLFTLVKKKGMTNIGARISLINETLYRDKSRKHSFKSALAT